MKPDIAFAVVTGDGKAFMYDTGKSGFDQHLIFRMKRDAKKSALPDETVKKVAVLDFDDYRELVQGVN